ncbi:MAG: lipid-A-disaccharide synthase [Kiritimatiellia bacterium]
MTAPTPSSGSPATPPSPRRLQIMICAGEISGDLYGAALVRQLRAQLPDASLSFFGIGGDQMREEGVELLAHASQTGVIGFWEVLKRIRFFSRLLNTLVKQMAARKPDLLLTIDYPGMNLRLAKKAKTLGIRAVHYVCPQVWAWHRDRIPKIAASVDQLICLFPFEPKLFEGLGLDVRFVGHPLVDQIEAFRATPHQPLPWGPGHKIALFAGSRRNEVTRLLPDILAGAKLAEKKLGPCSFLLPVPTEERADDVRALLKRIPDKPSCVEVLVGNSRQVLEEAEAAVVKSGTSTLEATLLDCPFLIVYRVSYSTYAIMKHLLTGVRFIGLVNIVPDKPICKELIQSNLTPKAICDELVALVNDKNCRTRQKAGLAEVRALLGSAGATARAAALIAAPLKQRP